MAKRKNTRDKKIKALCTFVVILLLIGIAILSIYFYLGKPKVINLKEKSNVDYKVYLKDNEFYDEKYIEKDNQYISELIDKIMTNYKYNLDIPDNTSYEYSYKIVAKITVKEPANDNTLYTFEEELFTKDKQNSEGNLEIEQDVEVNYPKYNDLINRFKTVYDLANVKSNIELNMFVNINNIEKIDKDIVDKKVSSLTIPLGENTISIDKNKAFNKSIITIVANKNNNALLYLIISIVIFAICIILIISIYIYSVETRTAEMIYEKEIKNIINNYDSYIQRINNSYEIGTSQVLKIESFNDILEIRDTLKQPILMLENDNKDGTFFIIPATNNIIYTYALRVVDIKAKMAGKEIPSYEVTEILHSDFIKNKKYTDDYIKEEITRTSMMPAVDDKNTIKGSADKTMDLYDQLELTRSFSIDEIKKAVKQLKTKKSKQEKAKRKTAHRKKTKK